MKAPIVLLGCTPLFGLNRPAWAQAVVEGSVELPKTLGRTVVWKGGATLHQDFP